MRSQFGDIVLYAERVATICPNSNGESGRRACRRSDRGGGVLISSPGCLPAVAGNDRTPKAPIVFLHHGFRSVAECRPFSRRGRRDVTERQALGLFPPRVMGVLSPAAISQRNVTADEARRRFLADAARCAWRDAMPPLWPQQPGDDRAAVRGGFSGWRAFAGRRSASCL